MQCLETKPLKTRKCDTICHLYPVQPQPLRWQQSFTTDCQIKPLSSGAFWKTTKFLAFLQMARSRWWKSLARKPCDYPTARFWWLAVDVATEFHFQTTTHQHHEQFQRFDYQWKSESVIFTTDALAFPKCKYRNSANIAGRLGFYPK